MKIVQKLIVFCFNIICMLSFCFMGCFNITAKAYAPVNASIAVEGIKFSDDNSHIYEIVIESLDNNSPSPESDRLFITDNGTGVFNIQITEPGTYVYKMYEKPGDDLNIIYDDNIYYATVFVTNTDDDNLTYAVYITSENYNYKFYNVIFKDVSLGYETSTPTITTTAIEMTSIETISVSTVTEITDSSVTTADSTSDKKTTDLIDIVLTGDNTPIGLLLFIMAISAITGLIMAILKKDNERRQ